MRFIKSQNINLKNMTGKGIKYDGLNNFAIIDTTKVMLIPKGAEGDKPVSPIDGYIRYNTTSNEFEFYQNSAWRKVRYKEPNTVGIHVQLLGTGDAVETCFGLLDSNDIDFPIPQSAAHILVLVENVLQIADVNYTLEESSSGSLAGPNSPYPDGWYIKFGTPPPIKDIHVIHNFDK